LIGGQGKNVLDGKDGADTFVFNDDSIDGLVDRVKDFDKTEGDVIVFDMTADVSFADLSFEDHRGGVIVGIDINGSFEEIADLLNVSAADLDADDFGFL